MKVALLLALLANAEKPAEVDDVDETMKRLGVSETQFDVVDKKTKKMAPPLVDDPVRFDLSLDTKHRDDGQHYQDPFVGREVFPELSATMSSRFVGRKTSNGGEPGGNDGDMALGGRVDLSLWLLDIRAPYDADRDQRGDNVELVLKAPFGLAEHHRLAPMVILHAPIYEGLNEALLEVALGYHYARAGFGLKLEVSAFSGSHARGRRGQRAGMLGWNGVVSYLIGDAVGIVVEVDGTTAVSERTGSTPPDVGDTVVRFLPGLRFFPLSPGFSIGVAAHLTFVPDGYVGLRRDNGVLLDVGYTFF